MKMGPQGSGGISAFVVMDRLPQSMAELQHSEADENSEAAEGIAMKG
jgi:hypothetical protein